MCDLSLVGGHPNMTDDDAVMVPCLFYVMCLDRAITNLLDGGDEYLDLRIKSRTL